jgi:hypothetical protein
MAKNAPRTQWSSPVLTPTNARDDLSHLTRLAVVPTADGVMINIPGRPTPTAVSPLMITSTSTAPS